MNALASPGIKDILNRLSESDLYGLMATVTQGLLKLKSKSKQEAVEVILKYSPDIFSILKRRVITRDLLFTYLHDKNVIVPLPTTKEKLITKICEIWNLTPPKSNDERPFTITTPNQNTEQATVQIDSNVNIMAKQFSAWFYEMLNNSKCMPTDHFYSDARLRLNIISDTSKITDETENPNAIVELLFNTKSEYKLFFNPNLNSEGIQGRLDPHGLVMVLACGTLHSDNCCVGLFEQVFTLARDPFCENNWKIKTTELNLRSKSGPVNTPSLADNELTSKLLSLPSEEL